MQLYSTRINGKVKKPRIIDWSGISTEDKIKEGIQLYFSKENYQVVSDSFLGVYEICCKHVHGNFTIGMYTTRDPNAEEKQKAEKEKSLKFVGTCMFTCLILIMENIYQLYQQNTASIGRKWQRFFSLSVD